MESSLKMEEEAPCCRWRPVPRQGWGLSPPVGRSWTAAAGGGRKVAGDFGVRGSPPKVPFGLCCSLPCGRWAVLQMLGGLGCTHPLRSSSWLCTWRGRTPAPIRLLVVQEPRQLERGLPEPGGMFPVRKDGGHHGGRPVLWP